MKYIMAAVLTIAYSSVPLYALEIAFMNGDVSVVRGGSKVSNLNIGSKIQDNDIIKTGKKSFVSIKFTDGTEIKILESSSLKIGKMESGTDTAPITLVSGIIDTKFAKMKKGGDSRRAIYTPTTVCAVRGTEFRVAVSDGADSRVELTEGSLDVHNSYGGSQIEAGQKMNTNVAEAPAADTSSSKIEDWKSNQDSSFSKNPEEKSQKFSTYINDFSVRSSNNSTQISNLDNNLKKNKNKKALEQSGKDLSAVSSSVEEDLYMNEAAGSAIENITDRFKKDKTEMYDKFLKLKEESNKVKEQQQRNYEAIQAVKAAYQKARDEILGKQKENTRKIKEGVDLNKVKPQINTSEPK